MRKVTSVVLLVLAALLAIPSVALIWVNRDVMSQDRFVATADQLAADPAVQDKVADKVTEAVMTHIPISSLINDAASELPPKAASALTNLVPALDSAVTGYVDKAVTAVITSDQFASVWNGVLKASHQSLMKVLSGDSDSDAITLQLGPVVDGVKTKLVDNGFALAEKIPSVDPQVTLYESPAISKARGWYDKFDTLRWVLPIATLLLLLLGVLAAKRRWTALMWGSLGIAVAMLLLGVATWIGRGQISEGLAVYDAFVPSLRGIIRWVFAGSMIVAAAGYLLGRRSRDMASIG